MKFFYKHWPLFLSIFLLLVFKIPSLFEPLWYDDEAITMTVGQELRHGVALYAQVQDNKPPLLYWLAASATSLWEFKLYLLFWSILGICVFYLLLVEVYDRLATTSVVSGSKLIFLSIGGLLFAYLYGTPRLEGNIVNGEVFMLPAQILAFYLLLRWTTERKTLLLLGSGLCLSLASLFKIPAAVDLLVGGLLLFILFLDTYDWKLFVKQLGIYIFGFGSLWVLVILYFLVQGTLSAMISAVFLQNWGYLSAWSQSLPIHEAQTATSYGLLLRSMFLFIVGVLLLIFRKGYPYEISLLLWWLIVSIFGALLSGRPYTHYLIEVIAALVLVFLLSMYATKLKLQTLFVFALAFFWLAVRVHHFWEYPVKSYYENFGEYLMGTKSRDSYVAWFDPYIADVEATSRWIRNITEPHERILVWSNKPAVYVLSRRRMISEFVAAYHVRDFNGYQEILDAIDQYEPRVIVWANGDRLEFPELTAIISQKYDLGYENESHKAYIRGKSAVGGE